MNYIKTKINQISTECLGISLDSTDSGWKGITDLAYDKESIIDAFREWAESKRGENISYPLSAFRKVADALLSATISFKQDPTLVKLLNDIAFKSDNNVLFTEKQKQAIRNVLKKESPETVFHAFCVFYEKLDERSIKFAAKNFSEQVEQVIHTAKKQKAEWDWQMRELKRIEAETMNVPKYPLKEEVFTEEF